MKSRASILLKAFITLFIIHTILMFIYVPNAVSNLVDYGEELSAHFRAVMNQSAMIQNTFIIGLLGSVAIIYGLFVAIKKQGDKLWVTILLLILLFSQIVSGISAITAVELQKSVISTELID